MNTVHVPEHMEASNQSSLLADALTACRAVGAPSRTLDARIALAVFPALRTLHAITPGVWRQCDETHVRALLYSATRRAAATLVPQGCWIESDQHGTKVLGERGSWVGVHPVDAIALCIAALAARQAEALHAH